MSKKILFVAYGGGHVTMLAPVFLALRSSGYEVHFLALTTAQKYLEKRNIPYFGFKDIAHCQTDAIQALGQKLVANQTAGVVSRAESICYLGASYADLISELGVDGAANAYRDNGRQAFFPICTLKKLIAELSPAVVVATNSPRAERAAIVAAGELGVPSVCLVDLFALQEVKWIGQRGYASKICVLNESVRQMFLEHGRASDEVVVTGNPAFDRLFDADVLRFGKELRLTRQYNDDKITILWASQVEPRQHPFTNKFGDSSLPMRIEQELRDFIEADDRFRLIIRYHPSEQSEFRCQKNVELSSTSDDLHSLLHAVDCVVVMTSTVGLEASLLGVPVISVDESIFTEDAPFSRMGISVGVRCSRDLPEQIRKLFPEIRSNVPLVKPRRSRSSRCGQSLATKNVTDVVESLFIN